MAKISKAMTVNYKGKEYTLEKFVNIIRDLSKEELSDLVGQAKYTKIVAQYVKDYPECLKAGVPVAVKK